MAYGPSDDVVAEATVPSAHELLPAHDALPVLPEGVEGFRLLDQEMWLFLAEGFCHWLKRRRH